ncbi:DUF4189 domain-containing protein [Mycobacterium sp. 1081908.1]|uniref:DUF4189 domain-containing protein n=1 Tax=Mycobacterium sp. 1081908.1 TaxID=1834066 RepID=UPI0007FC268D|nr:DUF4189 domain-containing protein [Mycobacterium sp. 1081908.1]OBK43265.1 hypothetical protein A5655_17030 [Mycobacterium sp. 1081908.1]
MTRHRIYALIALAAAAFFGAAFMASPAAQAATVDRYAVIAYSPVTGWTGWANNATTMEEATHVALGNCQRHGAGCTVASWTRNRCVALALGPGQWGADWGSTAAAAQTAALAKVSSGRVVEVHCTG